ncbi:Conserved_hypothetical protein [Hexamita inflata]|uniref:Uncharacterized protein n=1 Tax=Hexamita inflata TaxID=28002 RepID=A0AA86NRN7_9EUKA|nr:Conserved hypothetical protein [Hexamita inflata]
MSNYFTQRYLSAEDDNFLRKSLVPYLKRQFNISQETQQEQQVEKHFVEQQTQTDEIKKRSFDPVALFYDTIQSGPSTREIVQQVRQECQNTHSKIMQDTLYSLTSQHKEATEVLNKCLQAERTARQLEKQNLSSQITILQDKLITQAETAKCTRCQQLEAQIEQSNNQIENLRQNDLEKTYRVSELEQYLNQCLSDLKLSEQEKTSYLRSNVKLEEQIKLYQELLQRLNLQQLLLNQGQNNSIVDLKSYSNVNSTGSSVGVEGQLQKLDQEFLKFKKQQEIQLQQIQNAQFNPQNSYPQIYPQNPQFNQNQQFNGQNGQFSQAGFPQGEFIQFSKDTTPPAVPHMQYPPQLQQMQNNMMPHQSSALFQQMQEQIQHYQKMMGNLTGSAKQSEQNNPEKIERNIPTVKVSNIQEIENNKITSIMEDEPSVKTDKSPYKSPQKSSEKQREDNITSVHVEAPKEVQKVENTQLKVNQIEDNDFDDFDDDFDEFDDESPKQPAPKPVEKPIVVQKISPPKAQPKTEPVKQEVKTQQIKTETKPQQTKPTQQPAKSEQPKQDTKPTTAVKQTASGNVFKVEHEESSKTERDIFDTSFKIGQSLQFDSFTEVKKDSIPKKQDSINIQEMSHQDSVTSFTGVFGDNKKDASFDW